MCPFCWQYEANGTSLTASAAFRGADLRQRQTPPEDTKYVHETRYNVQGLGENLPYPSVDYLGRYVRKTQISGALSTKFCG